MAGVKKNAQKHHINDLCIKESLEEIMPLGDFSQIISCKKLVIKFDMLGKPTLIVNETLHSKLMWHVKSNWENVLICK